MNFKKSKVYKVLSALMIQGLLITNNAMAFVARDVGYTRKRSFGEKVMDFVEDYFNLLGVAVGLFIIIFYYNKLRKKLEELKKKPEYPSEENKNEVAKGLKETQRGYIIDYFFTFLIGLIIIVLSLIADV